MLDTITVNSGDAVSSDVLVSLDEAEPSASEFLATCDSPSVERVCEVEAGARGDRETVRNGLPRQGRRRGFVPHHDYETVLTLVQGQLVAVRVGIGVGHNVLLFVGAGALPRVGRTYLHPVERIPRDDPEGKARLRGGGDGYLVAGVGNVRHGVFNCVVVKLGGKGPLIDGQRSQPRLRRVGARFGSGQDALGEIDPPDVPAGVIGPTVHFHFECESKGGGFHVGQ